MIYLDWSMKMKQNKNYLKRFYNRILKQKSLYFLVALFLIVASGATYFIVLNANNYFLSKRELFGHVPPL